MHLSTEGVAGNCKIIYPICIKNANYFLNLICIATLLLYKLFILNFISNILRIFDFLKYHDIKLHISK